MPNGQHPVNIRPVKESAARRWPWLITTIAVVGSLFIAYVVHDRESAVATSPDNLTSQPETSPTTIRDTKSEIVSRLGEILAMRGRAYQKRDLEILKRIYTVDCPCLESDSNAIRELIKKKYLWAGGQTSLRVRRTERVTARMWTVVADFTSAPLRIETESGQLVREEPQGRDLFQFVLAKPTGSTQWLLGRATSYESG